MICVVTGKKVMFGRNVSHANNKTNRKFNINAGQKDFFSSALGRNIRVNISNNGLRTIYKYGSIDDFIIKSKYNRLHKSLQNVYKQIMVK